ncbi:MAG: amidohydrolase [Thermoplasmata archaeon]|nr:amidohydrolase [Thermoplasmata archaeon]
MDEETQNWIVEIRRDLHCHPDLTGDEGGTQEIIQGYLDELDIPHKPIAGTGVIATIEGAIPGRTIALRADIDALRITEVETDRNADYISRNSGVMHACGHDGHTAMVLGAARVLASQRDNLRGNVVLIFQPHEESHPGGSTTVIEEGGLEGVDAIMGFHIMGYIESGIIATKPGAFMAHLRTFEVTISGKSGHHMDPDQCIDPIVMASRFVNTIERDVANALDPTHPFTLGFGQFLGGTQFNQTPDHVFVSGTFRTFDEDDAEIMEMVMDRNLRSVVEAFTKDPEEELPAVRLRITEGYPVLANDPDLARWAVDVLREEQLVVDPIPRLNFGAEDFAHYCNHVPGLIMFLGTRNEAKGITAVNHSSRFDIDEDVLALGVRAFLALVTDFLGED